MDKITYTEKRFFEWHEDEVSVSIRACSGSYGGGSEVFIVTTESLPSVKIDENGVDYTLSDRDYKGVQCVVTEDAESNRNT